MAIKGSIEILTNGNSIGMVVNLPDINAVPVVVEAGQSLSDVTPVDAMPDDVTADAMWTARTADGFEAIVLFRKDRDLTLREIADAIEAAESED